MGKRKQLPEGMVQRGNVYHACFRWQGRLIRRRLCDQFEVARELLAELKSRAARGEFDLIGNDYPWDELKREFLRWVRQSLRRPAEYERDLLLFEQYNRVRSLKHVDAGYVLGYRTWRLDRGATPRTTKGGRHGKSRPVSPRTVNREVATLRRMLSKGVEWKRIGSNPIKGVKALDNSTPAKDRRPLMVEEVEALFAVSPVYLRPVWRFYMTTGFRRNELVELLFSDVDFERKVAIVRAGRSKSKKAREVPLDQEVLEEIARRREEAAARQPVDGKTPAAKLSRDHVFVTGANTPLRNNLLREFYRCAQRAGIDDAQPGGAVDIHSLRVSFTTLALGNGANPKDVQAILGHATLGVTMEVYAKATDRGKRDAINCLPFAKAIAPEHVSPFRVHRDDASPSDVRRDVQPRIWRAVGAGNSNTQAWLVRPLASLYVHHPKMRPDIDGLLDRTRAGRESGELADPCSHLLAMSKLLAAKHGAAWPDRETLRAADAG